MPSNKQIKAAQNIVDPSRTQGKALLDAGYSKNTAIKPTQVTRSKGFKDACEQLGIVEKLEMLRDMAADRAIETVNKAKFPDVARSTETFTKQIQLLTGKPTENVNELRDKSTEDLQAELESYRNKDRADREGASDKEQ